MRNTKPDFKTFVKYLVPDWKTADEKTKEFALDQYGMIVAGFRGVEIDEAVREAFIKAAEETEVPHGFK